MKIIYLSQYFPPEMGAPSARVYETTKNWVKMGIDVTVVTGFPNHPTGIVPLEYRNKLIQKELKNGIKVVRNFIYPAPNKGFFKRVLNYFSFMFSSIFLSVPKIYKPDILIATSPQFLVGIAGYVISKVKNCNFVLEIRDLWPESIVQLGQINNAIVIYVLRKIELFLYKKAKLIIVVVDSFKKYLEENGIEESKIKIIRNGVDLESFRSSSNFKGLLNKYNLKSKFVISYIGTIGLSHSLDKLVETAEHLKDKNDIFFIIIGEGAEKEKIKQLVLSKKLNNILLIDQVAKHDIAKYYAISDVCLVSLKKIALFKNALPSKMFEIMAMKKPILLCVDGEARKLAVDDASAAIYSEPENVSEMVKNIVYLKENSSVRKKLGHNGYEYILRNLNREVLSKEYLKYLSEL